MELRKISFPWILAAAWVVISAVTLHDFAGFASATRQEPPMIITSMRAGAAVPPGGTVGLARN